ncbi:hypothetical protein ACQP2T_22610 [Nonomuraea sp. CA-143628]|uniref:hypothetical protein n=1 Tax=Nonomuraea sp. CA-143628 TaxID=3239997 RepID=UPI003D908534
MRGAFASETIEIAPDPVVIGAYPVTVTFDLAMDAPDVQGRLIAPSGRRWSVDFAGQPPPCNWRAQHTFSPEDEIGEWRIEASAWMSVETRFFVEKAGTKPRTRFPEFDVQPREAVVGDPLAVTGRLESSADGDTWSPVPGRPVRITFRQRDTCGFVRVTEVRTDDRGAFRTRVDAEASGEYRAEFGGPGDDYIGSHSELVLFMATTNTEILNYRISPVIRRGKKKLKHTGQLHKIDTDVYPENETISTSMDGETYADATDDRGRFFIYTKRKKAKWTVSFGGNARQGLKPCNENASS